LRAKGSGISNTMASLTGSVLRYEEAREDLSYCRAIARTREKTEAKELEVNRYVRFDANTADNVWCAVCGVRCSVCQFCEVQYNTAQAEGARCSTIQYGQKARGAVQYSPDRRREVQYHTGRTEGAMVSG
jgi:hypothetical protein